MKEVADIRIVVTVMHSLEVRKTFASMALLSC